MNDLEYVQQKLASGLFVIARIEELTEVSRFNMMRIIDSKPVKQYIVSTLADFFRKVGD
jgi:hypothetical protein